MGGCGLSQLRSWAVHWHLVLSWCSAGFALGCSEVAVSIHRVLSYSSALGTAIVLEQPWCGCLGGCALGSGSLAGHTPGSQARVSHVLLALVVSQQGRGGLSLPALAPQHWWNGERSAVGGLPGKWACLGGCQSRGVKQHRGLGSPETCLHPHLVSGSLVPGLIWTMLSQGHPCQGLPLGLSGGHVFGSTGTLIGYGAACREQVWRYQ